MHTHSNTWSDILTALMASVYPFLCGDYAHFVIEYFMVQSVALHIDRIYLTYNLMQDSCTEHNKSCKRLETHTN